MPPLIHLFVCSLTPRARAELRPKIFCLQLTAMISVTIQQWPRSGQP